MGFLSGVFMAIRGLFTSKKFLVAAGSTVGAIAAGTPVGTALLAGGIAYVGGQGLADFGKVAAGK